MQLVEKHMIKKTDARFADVDRAAFASKNLYNAALYEMRQHFIFCGKYLNYNQMAKRMQKHEAYRSLPRKVSQQVLKLLDKNWKSYFEATRTYEEDPSKFLGRPKLPGYKDRKKGGISLSTLFRQFLKQHCVTASSSHLSLASRSEPDIGTLIRFALCRRSVDAMSLKLSIRKSKCKKMSILLSLQR